jgi:hypothetical protein
VVRARVSGPRPITLLRLLVLTLFAPGCADRGAPPGAPCSRASECATRLCLLRGDAGACAQRCTSTAGCTTGDICGRFDFRGIDPDSGLRGGDESEVLRVCRLPLQPACGTGLPCAGGRICLGDPGVCVDACIAESACGSRRCVPSSPACDAPAVCAPLCDDVAECPRGFYCDQTATDVVGHGRCLPVTGEVDAGTAHGCDAAVD